MSEADLGVRVFLIDNLSSPMGLLTDSLGFLGMGLLSAMNQASAMSDSLGALSMKVAEQQAAVEDAGAAWLVAQDALAANALGLDELSQSLVMVQDEMARVNAAPIDTFINDVALQKAEDDLTYYEEKVRLTEERIQLLMANPPTPANDLAIQNAELQLSQYERKVQSTQDAIDAIRLEGAANQQAEIAALQESYDALAVQQDELVVKAAEAGTALDAESAALVTTQAEADAATVSLNTLNDTLLLISGTLAAGIMFFLFADGMKTAIQDGSNLQDTMAQLQISIQGASSHLQEMTTYLFNVASSSIYTADQVAKGWNLLGEKGYTATQIMAGMGQQAINLAEAIGDPTSGTVGAANLLSTAMEVFRAKAGDASKYADLLAYAFYNGIPSVDGLRSALEQVGGRASMLNIPFDQIVIALDALGRAGMTGQQAGQSLNYALQALYAPVVKTQHELEYLGIITIGKNLNPQMDALAQKFRAAGSSMPKFDGTINSLDEIFKSGQKVGAIPLSATFNQWAIDNGLLSNAFYTSNGNAKDLITNLDILYQHLKNMTPEQQAAAFQQLFNVRSSQGVTQLMHSLATVDANYQKLIKSHDAQGKAAQDAAIRTATLSAAWKELQTTFTDFMALAGTPLIQGLANMIKGVNQFVGWITVAHPTLAKFFGLFLIAGTVAAGIGLIVGMIIVLTAVLGALDIALSPILLIVGAVMLAIIGVALAVAGIIYAIQHWGEITKQVGGWFSALGTKVHQIFNAMGKAIGDWFSSLGSKAHGAVTGFVNSIGQGFSTLGTRIHNALMAVVGIFTGFGSWLYNHNYYIKAIVDAWPKFIETVKQKITTVLNDIKLGFTIIWSAIRGVVETVVGAIRDKVMWAFNGIKFIIQADLYVIRAIVSTVWAFIHDNIISKVQAVFNIVTGIFKSLVGGVQGPMNNVVSTVTNAIGGLVSQALGWGANLIQGLINGIMSKVGGVASAVGNIAHTITSFLGFHSPTKEGPGREADKWMPNMMTMLARGLMDGTPVLANAAKHAASTIATGFTSPSIAANRYAYAATGSSNSYGNTTVSLELDGKCLTQVVLNRLTGQAQMSGSQRLLR